MLVTCSQLAVYPEPVVVVAETGPVRWAKTFGGAQREQGLAVTAMDGAVVVAGTFAGASIVFSSTLSLSRSDDDADTFVVACAIGTDTAKEAEIK